MKTQARGTRKAAEITEEMYQRAMEFGEPFREGGREYLDALRAAAEDRELSEQAKYELDIGQRAIGRGASAAGKRESGQTARSMSDLYSKVATDEYNRRYGRILDLANVGAGASSAAMQEAGQAGSSIASTYMAGGQTAADYIAAKGQLKASQVGAATQLAGAGLTGYAIAQEV
jgi:hypothetical protein